MANEFVCLLVDDDTDDQEIFLSVVNDIEPNILCVTAANGQEALSKLVSHEVSPNLIFIDINMPLMNGVQFLSEYNKHDSIKNIPVIILTTSSDRESIAETLRLGAKEYITKPDRFSSWGAIIKDRINKYRERA